MVTKLLSTVFTSLAVTAIIAGTAHASGTASPEGAAALPHATERLQTLAPIKVIAFGSSSTQGVGASSITAAYPSRLQDELSKLLPGHTVVVLNRGIGGEDSDDMALRLPSILAEHPDLVIWQTGSNDPLRDVPLQRFIDQTRDGIAAIKASGADVMLMEPQLCNRLANQTGADRYRDAVRQIGLDTGVPVIRRFELMQSWLAKGLLTRAQMLSADGLHMADAGYAMLASEVAHEIVVDTIGPSSQSAGLR